MAMRRARLPKGGRDLKSIRFEYELWELVKAEARRRSTTGRTIGASEVVRDLVREGLGGSTVPAERPAQAATPMLPGFADFASKAIADERAKVEAVRSAKKQARRIGELEDTAASILAALPRDGSAIPAAAVKEDTFDDTLDNETFVEAVKMLVARKQLAREGGMIARLFVPRENKGGARIASGIGTPEREADDAVIWAYGYQTSALKSAWVPVGAIWAAVTGSARKKSAPPVVQKAARAMAANGFHAAIARMVKGSVLRSRQGEAGQEVMDPQMFA